LTWPGQGIRLALGLAESVCITDKGTPGVILGRKAKVLLDIPKLLRSGKNVWLPK